VIAAHGLVLPVLIPIVAACLTLLLDGQRWQRVVLLGTSVLLVAVATWLLGVADGGDYSVYRLGNWPAPVAIVLVLDRLSGVMLLLSAIVGALGAWRASDGTDREAPRFHTLYLLQLAGLNGAFLAGDLFNLFVFFEILLIASYALLVYGSTTPRLRAGVQYAVLNLIGSSLFLVAIGVLYGVAGSLNLADLATRIAAAPASDAALLRSGALLLLVVFALKAAAAPLSFWLPGAYSAAAPAVATLFAMMTKVGVYAIIRTGTLLFGNEAGAVAGVYAPWLTGAAVATIAVGTLAAFGARSAVRMIAALLVVSVGTMLCAVALFTEQALAAALFYLVHSTIAAAAMFLVAGMLPAPLSSRMATGTLYTVGAIAIAGVPPLAGFLGKALILQATPPDARGLWIWGAVLSSSALGMIALARGGAMLFWEQATVQQRCDGAPTETRSSSGYPVGGALLVIVLLTVFAGSASAYARRTAQQLVTPGGYVQAVLATPGGR